MKSLIKSLIVGIVLSVVPATLLAEELYKNEITVDNQGNIKEIKTYDALHEDVLLRTISISYGETVDKNTEFTMTVESFIKGRSANIVTGQGVYKNDAFKINSKEIGVFHVGSVYQLLKNYSQTRLLDPLNEITTSISSDRNNNIVVNETITALRRNSPARKASEVISTYQAYKQNNNAPVLDFYVTETTFDVDGKIEKVFSLNETGYENLTYARADGKVAVKSSSFYLDGSKKADELFVNGKFHGRQTYYYKNGPKMLEQNFVNGVQEGVEDVFNADGSPKKRSVYKAGKIVSVEDFGSLSKIVLLPIITMVKEPSNRSVTYPKGGVALTPAGELLADMEYGLSEGKDISDIVTGSYKLYNEANVSGILDLALNPAISIASARDYLTKAKLIIDNMKNNTKLLAKYESVSKIVNARPAQLLNERITKMFGDVSNKDIKDVYLDVLKYVTKTLNGRLDGETITDIVIGTASMENDDSLIKNIDIMLGKMPDDEQKIKTAIMLNELRVKVLGNNENVVYGYKTIETVSLFTYYLSPSFMTFFIDGESSVSKFPALTDKVLIEMQKEGVSPYIVEKSLLKLEAIETTKRIR